VTRKLLSLIIVFLPCLILSACLRNVQASLDVSYPNLQDGRIKAAQAMTDMHKGRTDLAKANLDIA